MDYIKNPEWLVAIGTISLAIVTFLLAIIALFQDRLRSCTYKSNLDIEKGPFYPDNWRVPIINNTTGEFLADSCYLQFIDL